MSRDTFLSEVLYEADKVLEKFAAAPREYACIRRRTEQTINRKCMFFVILSIYVLIASIFVYICFVDCCIAANR